MNKIKRSLILSAISMMTMAVMATSPEMPQAITAEEKIAAGLESIQDYVKFLPEYKQAAGTPVIIDLYATWCGPCRVLSPRLEAIAEQYKGKVKVIKVDVDKNEQLARAARIQSIPTLLFVDSKGNIKRHVGLLTEEQLKTMTEALIGKK